MTTSDTGNLLGIISSSQEQAAIRKAAPRGPRARQPCCKLCFSKRSVSTSAVRREGSLSTRQYCVASPKIAFLLNRYHAMSAGEPEEAGLSEDEKTVLETYLRDFQLNPKVADQS